MPDNIHGSDASNPSGPVVGEFETAMETRPSKGSNAAADLIRNKIDQLYQVEPNAKIERAEAAIVQPRSVHQQYMYDLSTSGKSLAEIQTAWHSYYTGLPDDAKHQVWREFYDTYDQAAHTPTPQPAPARPSHEAHEQFVAATHAAQPVTKRRERRAVGDIKRQLLQHVQSDARKSAARQRFDSLVFGLSVGGLVLLIFLFGLFNEVVIAPFIQPSRTASATPIIFSEDTVAASTTPEVIIPKINVQIPVDYTLPDASEETVQDRLNNAVIHYPSTAKPGEQGNVAIFGHSSNNIFNKGKYKFAFVLLHELVPGDVFYLSNNGKVYAYKVFDKKIVEPTELTVLDSVAGKPATAVLITCDPPGTTLHRLVVWGEQISPDPTANVTATAAAPAATATPAEITGNGPSILSRLNPFD